MFQPFENTLETTPTPTTASPLSLLLNRLFGGDGWKALLKDTKVSSHKPAHLAPTVSPSVQQQTEHKISQVQEGFYNNQVSAGVFQPGSTKEQSHANTPVLESHQPLTGHTFTSRVGNKSVGSHSLTKTSSDPPVSTESAEYTENKVNNGNTNFKSATQAPNIGGLEQISPQYFGGDLGMSSGNGWVGSEETSFDPDKVNSPQRLYDPSSAFGSFVTQTGSDPENTKLPTSYDADAVNQRYMLTGVFRYPPGTMQSSQAGHGAQFSSSAYGGAQPFDADALNRALMSSALSGSKGPAQAGPPYNSEFNPAGVSPLHQSSKPAFLQPVSRTNPQTPSAQKLVTEKETVKHTPHKIGQVQSRPATEAPTTEAPKPKAENKFSFIPGSLFPSGVQTSRDSSSVQQHSQPSFLVSGNAQRSPGFDPDAINAAQASYNPNAINWIKPRSEPPIMDNYEMEDEMPNNNISLPSNQSAQSVTTDTNPQNSGGQGPNYAGFDPNIINADQGQSSFVPGQIAPQAYGDSGGYGGRQQTFTESFAGYGASNQNSQPISGSNFGVSANGTSPRYNGLGFGMNSFNPDSINMNFANMFGNKSNTGFGMSGSDSSFSSGSFGPNMAAAGFGTAQSGSTNGTSGMYVGYGMGFSSGGFDPNAVNRPGYGSSGGSNSSSSGADGNSFGGFGGYPSFYGGGYGAASYDPNLINQHFIHSPYGSQPSNSSGGSMNYFLGVSSGGSPGGGSSYQSPFISAFDPSSVNHAVYDPNKFNSAHMNFDPLEMLTKNPGMDKATLQSATFDPDKANNEYTQIKFSPVGMIASSIGLNKTVLNSLTFDPSTAGQASFVPSQMGTPYSQPSGNITSHNQPIFDPVEVMRQLMQGSGGFRPGSSSPQQMNFDPSQMFQQGPLSGITPSQQQQLSTQSFLYQNTSSASPTVSTSNSTTSARMTTAKSILTTLLSTTLIPKTNLTLTSASP